MRAGRSLTGGWAARLLERGAVERLHPCRDGLDHRDRLALLVVSDKLAAGAVPLGGATVNVIFMKHVQRLAEGYCTARRLERRYRARAVEQGYATMARQITSPRP